MMIRSSIYSLSRVQDQFSIINNSASQTRTPELEPSNSQTSVTPAEDTQRLAQKERSLEQVYVKKEQDLDQSHAFEQQKLQREYRQAKHDLDVEYQQKKRTLDFSIYA
ncbi:MAG: hypothetical protein D3926_06040 [Desulfobacteraceae bacterium]|nr:MAG: hypothetical protein D3926_06040 [Desulfobacteraceae bacterium]